MNTKNQTSDQLDFPVFREIYEQNGLQIDNPFGGLIASIIEQEEK